MFVYKHTETIKKSLIFKKTTDLRENIGLRMQSLQGINFAWIMKRNNFCCMKQASYMKSELIIPCFWKLVKFPSLNSSFILK